MLFLPCGRTRLDAAVSLFWSLDMATLDAVREAGFEAWGARVVELEPKAADWSTSCGGADSRRSYRPRTVTRGCRRTTASRASSSGRGARVLAAARPGRQSRVGGRVDLAEA